MLVYFPATISMDANSQNIKTSCERNGSIRTTSGSSYGSLINPPPSLRKISYKYNYLNLYSGVVFFSFIFRDRVRVKNRIRVRDQ